MYQKPFYITDAVGNNALSFPKRKNKKLFVTNLIEIDTLNKLTLGEEIVFEDFDFDGQLISARGLENFYLYHWNGIPMYIFDNHNHALYFWYKAYHDGIITNNAYLYHVDEHADMRVPERIISSEDTQNLQKVFEYTNFEVNVGNYIVPAIENDLFCEVVQIRNETNLLEYDFKKQHHGDVVLNLDVDFFEPALDYIDFELKKKVILDISTKSKCITIATSPYFIDQKLAIGMVQKIFGNLKLL